VSQAVSELKVRSGTRHTKSSDKLKIWFQCKYKQKFANYNKGPLSVDFAVGKKQKLDDLF